MMRASVSRSSSFGVVPLAISEWKPEIAPHAIVMKQNGKICPAKIGPVAVDEPRDRGHLEVRPHHEDARPRAATIVPSFTNVRQVVARREQEPDREHGRGEAVDDDRERERLLSRSKNVRERRMLVDPAAGDDGERARSATPPIVASSTRPGPQAPM